MKGKRRAFIDEKHVAHARLPNVLIVYIRPENNNWIIFMFMRSEPRCPFCPPGCLKAPYISKMTALLLFIIKSIVKSFSFVLSYFEIFVFHSSPDNVKTSSFFRDIWWQGKKGYEISRRWFHSHTRRPRARSPLPSTWKLKDPKKWCIFFYIKPTH